MNIVKSYTLNWKSIAVMLLLAIGIASCSDEEIIGGTVGKGTPVTVSFDCAVPAQDLVVSSRAIGDETAKKVENIYIIGFNEGDNKAFGLYEIPGSDNTVTSSTKIPAGTYEVYAVANIDSDVYGIGEGNTGADDNLKTALDNIKTKNEFLTMAVTMLSSARNLDRSGTSLLMAGALDNNGSKTVNINTDGQVVKTIKLKRLDSEITFKFKGKEGVTFTAKRWYAVNAPAKSFLIEQNTDAATTDDDFFHTYIEEEEKRNPAYDNTFTFYMPENKKKAKKSGITTYHDREKEVKNQDNTNHSIEAKTQRRNYVYAPQDGTHIVVTGHYEGPSNSKAGAGVQNASAEVQYIIHLGCVNGADDFFTNRNTKYTYNVTVNGVDDIIVEVESDNGADERQPGATGDVIIGGSKNVYTLDAHYEQVLLTFDYQELLHAYEDIPDKDLDAVFTCVVSTPYTSRLTTDQAKMEDMQWVKVMKHEDPSSTEFRTYWDYNAQYPMTSVQKMLDDFKMVLKGEKSPVEVFSPTQDGRLLATYTCFIDEFYYEENDLPSDVRGKLPDNTNIWKSFVNTPNRNMYIICDRKKSADKESSVVSSKYVISQRSIQTFYSTEPTPGQKIIAYGMETLNETGNLWATANAFPADQENGWANSELIYATSGWGSVTWGDNGYKSLEQNRNVNKYGNLNPEGSAVNESNYLRAMTKMTVLPYTMGLHHACLQRNRRENKSSTVSKEEVKWYLPAIKQYQAFYIGEPAISQEARLFDYPTDYGFINSSSYQFLKHYGASNYSERGNTRKMYVFWAEEATSVSTLAQQLEWVEIGSSKDNPEKELLKRNELRYRCMRNLGADGHKNQGKYDPYQTITADNAGRTKISVERLSPLVKSRGRVTGELGPHFYQDKTNLFYSEGFEVATAEECYNLITTLERVTGVDKSGTGCEALNVNLRPGDAKWRVPNLRELTLMWQNGLINEPQPADAVGNYMGRATSRTQMSYKYGENEWYRKGWVAADPKTGGANNLGMSRGNEETTVRCVRDLKK